MLPALDSSSSNTIHKRRKQQQQRNVLLIRFVMPSSIGILIILLVLFREPSPSLSLVELPLLQESRQRIIQTGDSLPSSTIRQAKTTTTRRNEDVMTTTISKQAPSNNKKKGSAASKSTTSATTTSLAKSLESTPLGSLGPKGTSRAHFEYYDSLFFLAMQYGRNAKTLLEVGCARDPFAKYLDWIDDKTCVAPYRVVYEGGQDNKKQSTASKTTTTTTKSAASVKFVQADFLNEFTIPTPKYDLILCSQVVEHVPDPAGFVQKLVQSAKTSIISVPYNWGPCGETCGHVNHRITLETIKEWAGPFQPKHHTIVGEGSASKAEDFRMVVVFSES